MSYNSKSFGVVIGKLRVQNGLSQMDMANRAGIARTHLIALENGKKTAKLNTVWKIAEALNIRPSELILLVEVVNEL